MFAVLARRGLGGLSVITVGALLAGLFAAVAVAGPLAGSADAATKTVRIVNQQTGRALGSSFSGKIVAGINNPALDHQRWERIDVGNGVVRYRNVRYKTCLDTLGKSTSTGAALQLLPCDGSSTQLWTRGFSGGTFRQLTNVASSRSATVEDKTAVRLRFFAASGNQLWSETGV